MVVNDIKHSKVVTNSSSKNKGWPRGDLNSGPHDFGHLRSEHCPTVNVSVVRSTKLSHGAVLS